MSMEKLIKKYIPMTEATFYILISLNEPLHGYGIMQNVEELSQGRVKLGPGTLYGALGKLEKEDLIQKYDTGSNDRRKSYLITDLGKKITTMEFERMKVLVSCSESIITSMGVK